MFTGIRTSTHSNSEDLTLHDILNKISVVDPISVESGFFCTNGSGIFAIAIAIAGYRHISYKELKNALLTPFCVHL